MIDVGALATSLGGVLAPALPYLLQGAGAVADEAVKALAPNATQLAERVWDRLRSRVEANPAARDAAQRAAARPQDSRVRGALELQLEALLEDDRALAAELAHLLESAPHRAEVNVQVSGERAVGVGGNVSGGTITTGDTLPGSKPGH